MTEPLRHSRGGSRILELDSQNTMTKDEIAKAVGVGVATVYRVLKEN